MAWYAYDRLTALDNSFLAMENPNGYMHVASTSLFDAAPLRTREGGIDFDAVKRAIAGVLHEIPRYRQKLKWIPLENRPVWVDDESFFLDYHVRHTSLPRPGTVRQLKRLAARIISQHLDRSKPLWETWVIEGVEGGRFAIIIKAHHCMIDGISGVDLLSILMSESPDAEIPEPAPFVVRPEPSRGELLGGEVLRRVGLPFRALGDVRAFAREAHGARRELAVRARAVAHTLRGVLRPPSDTPLNGPVGPHRRFDWLVTELADVDAVRKALGGSLNDVVLAAVTGAVRSFLEKRNADPARLEFRVLAPVDMRTPAERGTLGNRVSAWILKLPVGEPDPRVQLREIVARTSELKRSRRAVGAEVLTRVAEWTPSVLLSLGTRAATRLLPFNMVVTNVPGPPRTLYTLGARLLECYPSLPLMGNLALGVALFSYEDRLCWGFTADWELLPDLHRFIEFLETSFQELRKDAGSVVQLRPRRDILSHPGPRA